MTKVDGLTIKGVVLYNHDFWWPFPNIWKYIKKYWNQNPLKSV